MAAGSFSLHIAAVKSVNNFLCSPSLSPTNVLPHSVKHPHSRLTSCSSLLATEVQRRDEDDFLRMESSFSSLFLSLEKSFDCGVVDTLGADQVVRAPWDPWDILQVGREEDAQENDGAVSAPLVWRDAPVRYANVMWFKGPYNVEIICGENEPEESIVRRLRQAVSKAGVIRECRRRRYLETPQDTIKRKQLQRAINRKQERKKSSNPSNSWTQNAWKLSQEHLKPIDHNKKKQKKKSSRKFVGQSRFDTSKDASDRQTNDLDDDYWGFVDEGDEDTLKPSSH